MPATTPAPLIREIVRLYVRAQRKQAKCGDGESTVQCHVLTELLREEGLAQQALVERLGLDKGWISRAVDTLVMDGCILKQASEQDRRSVTLSLTPAGRTRAVQLECELNQHAAQLLEHIPRDRHAQVQESLQLLLQALSTTLLRPTQCGALVLRAAASKDWPAIKRMLLAASLPVDGARDHLTHFMVGEAGGKLMCAGGLEMYGENALLRSVVVAAQARGQGLGKQLVIALAEHAAGLGVASLYLLTTSAEHFFSGQGYRATSRAGVPAPLKSSREFLGACPGDAIVMMLHIHCSRSNKRKAHA